MQPTKPNRITRTRYDDVFHTVSLRDRSYTVQRTTWANAEGLAFDVFDAATGQRLTVEPYNDWPSVQQIEDLLDRLTEDLRQGTLDPFFSGAEPRLREITGTQYLKLTPESVTVFARNHWAAEVLIVPDEVARRMERERKDGWREFKGAAFGVSKPFPAGTWMYEVITTLMAAYVASPMPDCLTGDDRELAQQERHGAANRWHLRPGVVGASDWNPETGDWRNWPANEDLHVFGSVSRVPGADAYLISG